MGAVLDHMINVVLIENIFVCDAFKLHGITCDVTFY